MKYIKAQFTIFLCVVTSVCYGQGDKYDLSEPTGLQESGWNKVLCLKNGNTMLFHFEPSEKIQILAYDSLHRQIAKQMCPATLIDDSKLKETLFQGLFEAGGEAVLFLDQEHAGKHVLVRLRFNDSGALAEEKQLAESPGKNLQTDFTVVNNKAENGYAVVYCTDDVNFQKCDLHITYYSDKHQQMKNIPMEVDRKKYDKVAVIGAEAATNGICVSLMMGVKETDKAGNPVSHNYILVYYIPNGGNKAITSQVVDLASFFPVCEYYTYNPFATALNFLLLGAQPPAADIKYLFLRFDEADMKLSFNWIKNTEANNYLHTNVDSTQTFEGIPASVYTNDNGLTTVVMESYTVHADRDAGMGGNINSYLGNIGITQYDDDGKEIWGTVLPRWQCYKSTASQYDFSNIFKKGQTQMIFAESPEDVYKRQFYSTDVYCRNRNHYIIFNDYSKNFGNTIKSPGDTAYNMRSANACYYSVDRKREISKHYLFGDPGPGEYTSSFIEGAGFDGQRGVYAALVRCQKGMDISLRMAWGYLE